MARRVAALRCRCAGVRRQPELGASEGLANVVGVGELRAAPPDADVIVSAAPLTQGSVSLPSPRRLALLPAGAIVVNVARGALVSDEAPVDALNRNHFVAPCWMYSTRSRYRPMFRIGSIRRCW